MIAELTPPLVVGTLTLCRSRRALAGPHGSLVLSGQLYRVTERLMRRPEALVSSTDLIAAMYPDVDDEAERSDLVLRLRIRQLRGAILVLTRNAVRVRTEREMGYAIEVQR